jgi:hypothetical protein
MSLPISVSTARGTVTLGRNRNRSPWGLRRSPPWGHASLVDRHAHRLVLNIISINFGSLTRLGCVLLGFVLIGNVMLLVSQVSIIRTWSALVIITSVSAIISATSGRWRGSLRPAKTRISITQCPPFGPVRLDDALVVSRHLKQIIHLTSTIAQPNLLAGEIKHRCPNMGHHVTTDNQVLLGQLGVLGRRNQPPVRIATSRKEQMSFHVPANSIRV